MKVPIDWLKHYVDVPEDTQSIARDLTSIGHMQDGPFKEVAGDTVIDLEIRQNRSDCLSLIGIAREVAAITGHELKLPKSYTTPLSLETKDLSITIENTDVCYRFNAIEIGNIHITESPEWLKKRLESYGIKSINNVVDITNFVMIECGQPLHAFDKNKVDGQTIRVRLAQKGEKLHLLSDQEIELDPQDLVIADSVKVLALAGVMGGKESAVTNNTTSIILEAATYNQASIRRSSIRHQLRTEASTRLEKFLHPHLTQLALQRASELICDICEGTLVSQTDTYPHKKTDIKIRVNEKNIKRIGGIEIPTKKASDILLSLQIPNTIEETEIEVHVPYFRTDLLIEEDIIEEILRMHGYDSIPERLIAAPAPKNITSKDYALEERIKDSLTALGFDEQITEPLTNEMKSNETPIFLENSLNSNKKMLRTTLQHNLVNVVKNRLKYKIQENKVFEIGKIYFTDRNEYQEAKKIGILISGEKTDFLSLKGYIEALFEKENKEYNESYIEYKKLSSPPNTFYAEIDFAQFRDCPISKPEILSTPPQLILQDFSFIVSKDIQVGDIIKSIKEISSSIFSIGLGENPRELEDNKKSVFLHVAFLANNRLTNENIEKERESIIKTLQNTFKATIR
jgi:phenylalanyl-tRNA synthetase beta chain